MRPLLPLLVALAACRPDTDFDTGFPDSGTADAAVAQPDALVFDPIDGPPVRHACTETFGTALSTEFGRLDGILVAIVKPGTPGCASDTHHLHLQVAVSGSVYDVAVNIAGDVSTATRSLELDAPWSEGWHTSVAFDYAKLGAHASDFASEAPATLVSDLASDLAVVNHISIYSTGYSPGHAPRASQLRRQRRRDRDPPAVGRRHRADVPLRRPELLGRTTKPERC